MSSFGTRRVRIVHEKIGQISGIIRRRVQVASTQIARPAKISGVRVRAERGISYELFTALRGISPVIKVVQPRVGLRGNVRSDFKKWRWVSSRHKTTKNSHVFSLRCQIQLSYYGVIVATNSAAHFVAHFHAGKIHISFCHPIDRRSCTEQFAQVLKTQMFQCFLRKFGYLPGNISGRGYQLAWRALALNPAQLMARWRHKCWLKSGRPSEPSRELETWKYSEWATKSLFLCLGTSWLLEWIFLSKTWKLLADCWWLWCGVWCKTAHPIG